MHPCMSHIAKKERLKPDGWKPLAVLLTRKTISFVRKAYLFIMLLEKVARMFLNLHCRKNPLFLKLKNSYWISEMPGFYRNISQNCPFTKVL